MRVISSFYGIQKKEHERKRINLIEIDIEEENGSAPTPRNLRRSSKLFLVFFFLIIGSSLMVIWLFEISVSRLETSGMMTDNFESLLLGLERLGRKLRGNRDIRDEMPNYALELQIGQQDRLLIERWRMHWSQQQKETNRNEEPSPRVVEFFIYDDLPPEANRLILQEDPDRASSSHAHSTDVVLHLQLERPPSFRWHLFNDLIALKRTLDPSTASLFFVPAYMTNALKMEKEKQKGDEGGARAGTEGEAGLKTWRSVMETLRFGHFKDRWNQNCEEGCDHALVFSSGSGPAMVDGYRQLFGLSTSEREGGEGGGEEPGVEKEMKQQGEEIGNGKWVSKMPLFLVDAGLTFVDLQRDVSIPYVLPDNLRCSDWTVGVPRRYLIHFRGGIGNKKVRIRLAKALNSANVTGSFIKDEEGKEEGKWKGETEGDRLVLFSQEKLSREDYWQELRESIFCLMPQGWTPNSRHFVEAVISGCIPVIISPRWVPSFTHLTDLSYPASTTTTSTFSSSSSLSPLPFMLVHAHNELKSILPRIEGLANISVIATEAERRKQKRNRQELILLEVSSEVRRMQESLMLACKHFEWPSTPPSPYVPPSGTSSSSSSSQLPVKGDAIHSILEQWLLRSYMMGNRRLKSILDPSVSSSSK